MNEESDSQLIIVNVKVKDSKRRSVDYIQHLKQAEKETYSYLSQSEAPHTDGIDGTLTS
jgi:hypothetical protein